MRGGVFWGGKAEGGGGLCVVGAHMWKYTPTDLTALGDAE